MIKSKTKSKEQRKKENLSKTRSKYPSVNLNFSNSRTDKDQSWIITAAHIQSHKDELGNEQEQGCR